MIEITGYAADLLQAGIIFLACMVTFFVGIAVGSYLTRAGE